MATDLDTILNDKPIETPSDPVEPGDAAPAEGQEAELRDEYQSRRKALQEKEWTAQGRDPQTGQFLPKPETGEVQAKEPVKEVAKPPEQELSEKERAFLAKANDETRKRQQIEQEFNEFRARASPPAPKPQEPAKTFFDDPDGFLAERDRRVELGMMQNKADTSEMIARSQHQDYDEVFKVFAEVAKTTPGLVAQAFAAPHPAEFAYRVGKNYKEIQAAGSIDAMREKIEKETRLKLEQEYKEKEERLLKERASIPGSLTDARGSVTTRPVWTGPTPMDTILKPH